MLHRHLSPAVQVLANPLGFVLRVLKNFQSHRGLLLAGAIAYYALISLVPLLILSVIALSRLVSPDQLLDTLGRYLDWMVPSQSAAVLDELSRFLEQQVAIGTVMLGSLIFFSSVTFSAMNQAMGVIFGHRNGADQRSSLFSLLLPFAFVGLLGIGLLAVTLISVGVQARVPDSVAIAGHTWYLEGVSGTIFHLLGLITEALMIAAIYHFLPVGRVPIRHALVGGVAATALWEVIRHGLVWYFSSLSNASVVYGSLTSAIAILLSFELAATLLLLGAEVIAEYERLAQPAGETSIQLHR